VDSNTTLGNTSSDTVTINGSATFNSLADFDAGLNCDVGLTCSATANVTGKITGTGGMQVGGGPIQFDSNVIIGDSGTACYIQATVSESLSLSESSDVIRDGVNYLDKVKESHTHWQKTVTLTSASANAAVTLFDTDDDFTRYEFGTSTGSTDALNSSTLATGCFNLLISFQGYTAAGIANAYLFGSGHIHTNLKVAAYGIPGYNVGTNDTTAPNSVNVPVSQSYHISSVDPPTVRWQAVSAGPALIQLVWSSTMPTITTGSTVVTCKLVKIADWA
jgi:hypothetical protein